MTPRDTFQQMFNALVEGNEATAKNVFDKILEQRDTEETKNED